LLGHRQAPIPRDETGVFTVDAAADGHGAIPIWAGKADIERNFMDPAAKGMPQMIGKTHIPLVSGRQSV
jgi:hypothetical protein